MTITMQGIPDKIVVPGGCRVGGDDASRLVLPDELFTGADDVATPAVPLSDMTGVGFTGDDFATARRGVA